MAAQASSAARYNVMDGRRQLTPSSPDSIPTAALTHALSGAAGKTAADREIKKNWLDTVLDRKRAFSKFHSGESLTSTKNVKTDDGIIRKNQPRWMKS